MNKYALIWKNSIDGKWNLSPTLYSTRQVAEAAKMVEEDKGALIYEIVEIMIPVEVPA